MPWIIVLGERDAVDWVLTHERMAVSARVRTAPSQGDNVALYVTRGAFHNPTSDEAQVIGLGTVAGPVEHRDVEVSGVVYPTSFRLAFEVVAKPKTGLPFLPLVRQLEFITNKSSWGGALRRPLVHVSSADYGVIDKAFRKHLAAGTAID